MNRRRLLGFAVAASVVTVLLTWAVYLASVDTSRLLYSHGNTSFYLREQHLQVYRWNANDASTLFDVTVFAPLITCGLLWVCWILYRARRHLFAIGAAASLVICVTFLAKWTWQVDYNSESGLTLTREMPKTARFSSLNCGIFYYAIEPAWGKGMLFPGKPPVLVVYIPYWALSLPLMIAPGLWFSRHRRRRSQTWPSCTTCSYDLTANESGVCPECGTPVSAEHTAVVSV